MKSAIYVGIDIARHWLQLCSKELSLEQSVSYESEGLNALIKQLKKRRSQVHVICEATLEFYGSPLRLMNNLRITYIDAYRESSG
jgi:hypothetical protein